MLERCDESSLSGDFCSQTVPLSHNSSSSNGWGQLIHIYLTSYHVVEVEGSALDLQVYQILSRRKI